MRKSVFLMLFFFPALLLAQSNPKAVIDTTAGTISCVLFKDKVPTAVENFIGLATGKKDWTNPVTKAKKTNTPLYDGTIFHRVIPDFMIQGGDPEGNGNGDPGYKLADEFSPDLKFDRPGRLAYANSGKNTNGSQFFITEAAYPSLDPCLDKAGCVRGGNKVSYGYGYTIFGQCEPLELVKHVARMPRDPNNDKPYSPVRIKHIDIVEAGAAPAAKK